MMIVGGVGMSCIAFHTVSIVPVVKRHLDTMLCITIPIDCIQKSKQSFSLDTADKTHRHSATSAIRSVVNVVSFLHDDKCLNQNTARQL